MCFEVSGFDSCRLSINGIRLSVLLRAATFVLMGLLLLRLKTRNRNRDYIEEGRFGAVVTCFFIGTATNIYQDY